jgi:hypothetical protein
VPDGAAWIMHRHAADRALELMPGNKDLSLPLLAVSSSLRPISPRSRLTRSDTRYINTLDEWLVS